VRHMRLGPDRGRLVLRTSREGFAAQAGHDLTITFSRWSAEAGEGSISVTVDLSSFEVLDGSGGIKPLTERDKREIQLTARRLLDADRQPEATYRSEEVGDGVVDGTLALRGVQRPLRLTVSDLGGDRYRVTGTVRQSDFGITPYTAFFGSLKVADPVAIEAEVDLSSTGG
jgi:polyisoprenoid-binding protein YceI